MIQATTILTCAELALAGALDGQLESGVGQADLIHRGECLMQGLHGACFCRVSIGNSPDLAQQPSRLISEKNLLQRFSTQARIPKSTQSYVDDFFGICRSVE